MRWFRADLHIHTVLSACADLSMGPRDIVRTALARGLDIIAITDHNAAENVAAVHQIAQTQGLTVIPGIEVSSREEIHFICLFPDVETVMRFNAFVRQNLQEGEYDSSLLGPQIVCDADENIIAENTSWLALPIKKSYQEVAEQVVQYGGIIYPAHIERRANGILPILGFLPSNLPYDVVEVSKRVDPKEAEARYSHNQKLTVLTASDAHDLEQIGVAPTYFWLEQPTFAEIRAALLRQDQRVVRLTPSGEDEIR